MYPSAINVRQIDDAANNVLLGPPGQYVCRRYEYRMMRFLSAIGYATLLAHYWIQLYKGTVCTLFVQFFIWLNS